MLKNLMCRASAMIAVVSAGLCVACPVRGAELTLESGKLRLRWEASQEGWRLKAVQAAREGGWVSAGEPGGEHTLIYSKNKPPGNASRAFDDNTGKPFPGPAYHYQTDQWRHATNAVSLNTAGTAHHFYPTTGAATAAAGPIRFQHETDAAVVVSTWSIDPAHPGDVVVMQQLTAKLINETLARREWAGRDPIGAEVSANSGRTWSTVVGVVSDVKTFALNRESVPQVYIPLRQSGGLAGGRVLVRMNGDPQQATAIIRETVRSIDPDLPIENVRTLDEIRERYLATPRLTAILLTVFAALALLVTITGITGVIAQSVSQRTQEFGLRMALGASQTSVLGMVLGQGLTLVGVGLVIGIGASFALARVLQTYLYQTTPTDPLTLVGVALAFILAGTLACLGPAWRATAVDPMLALRAD